MRGLTIDYVRRRRAKKRGGEFHITAAGEDRPAFRAQVELGGELALAAFAFGALTLHFSSSARA